MKYGMVPALLLALAAGGCASKKFVRSRVDPLAQRVDALEGQNKQQSDSIEELEDAVSLADERALAADQKAERAASQALEAGRQAKQAGDTASGAQSLAERGHSRLDAFGRALESLDNYRLAGETMVFFGLESAALDEEAKARLDEAAASVSLKDPSVVEVRGFTDTTGRAAYNLVLSERRAQTVVRYLATQHDIPLRQIHMLGLGSEAPHADNKTREGRKMNRRVEVKVYVADQAELTALR